MLIRSVSILAIISIVFFDISCFRSKDEVAFNDFIDKYPPRGTDSIYYLILPGQGCSGCITTAENFVSETFKNSAQFTFFFVNYLSEAMLRYKLGDSIINSKNVVLVKEQLINRKKLEGKDIYPCLLLFVNRKLIRVSFQSPENPDLLMNIKNEIFNN